MADNKVLGKNFLAYMKIGEIFYPVFCGKTVELALEQDEIETTHVNAGPNREYVPGLANSLLSCTGVTTSDNTNGRISIFYLMQQSVRREIQQMRVVATDNDSNVVVISFSAFIRSTNVNRDSVSFSQSSVVFRVTGGMTFDTIIPDPAEPVCEIEDPLYLTLAEDGTEVSDSLLEQDNVTILEVQREGTGLDETTGTPGNRQFKFVGGSGNGKIQIDPNNPGFPGGETIYVLYKITT